LEDDETEGIEDMAGHIGVGLYEDGRVEMYRGTEGLEMTIEEWREVNRKVESLAKSAGI